MVAIFCACYFIHKLPSAETELRHRVPFFGTDQTRTAVRDIPSHQDPLCTVKASLQDRIAALEEFVSSLEPTAKFWNRSRRDFALATGGASILPSLTSPTYGLPRKTILSRLVSWARGCDVMDANINLPTVVIGPGNDEIGECWEFAGGAGHISIHLPERIYISEIVVNHVSPIVSAAMARKAPREMSLWGLVDHSLTLGQEPSEVDTLPLSHFQTSRSSTLDDPRNFFILLTRFQYAMSALPTIQSFPIVGRRQRLGFQTVVVKVDSNWASNSTCLYRVRIHGTEVIQA